MKSEIEIQPGKILKTFSKEETESIEKKWTGVFCKNKQGFNTKAFKWHIFSGSGYPSTDGEISRQDYLNQISVEYIVIGDDHEPAIKTDLKPIESNISDFYVFPENMAWTMAFTHEEGWLGPYFAKHPKYDILNAENMKRVENEWKKLISKEKGWS